MHHFTYETDNTSEGTSSTIQANALREFEKYMQVFFQSSENTDSEFAKYVYDSVCSVIGGHVESSVLKPMYRTDFGYARSILQRLALQPPLLMKMAIANPELAASTQFPDQFMGLKNLIDIQRAYLPKHVHKSYDETVKSIKFIFSSLRLCLGAIEGGDGQYIAHPQHLAAIPANRHKIWYQGVSQSASTLEYYLYTTLLAYQAALIRQSRITPSFLDESTEPSRRETPDHNALWILDSGLFSIKDIALSSRNVQALNRQSPQLTRGLYKNELGAMFTRDRLETSASASEINAQSIKLTEILSQRSSLPSVFCSKTSLDILINFLKDKLEPTIGQLIQAIPSTLKMIKQDIRYFEAVDRNNITVYSHTESPSRNVSYFYGQTYQIRIENSRVFVSINSDPDNFITAFNKSSPLEDLHASPKYQLSIKQGSSEEDSEEDVYLVEVMNHLNSTIAKFNYSAEQGAKNIQTETSTISIDTNSLTIKTDSTSEFCISLDNISEGYRWQQDTYTFHYHNDELLINSSRSNEKFNLTRPSHAVEIPQILAVNEDPDQEASRDQLLSRKEDDITLNKVVFDLLTWLYTTPPTRMFDKAVRNNDFTEYVPHGSYIRKGLLSILSESSDLYKSIEKITKFLAIKEMRNKNEILSNLISELNYQGHLLSLEGLNEEDLYIFYTQVEAAAHFALLEIITEIKDELQNNRSDIISAAILKHQMNGAANEILNKVTPQATMDDFNINELRSYGPKILLKSLEINNLDLFTEILANNGLDVEGQRLNIMVNPIHLQKMILMLLEKENGFRYSEQLLIHFDRISKAVRFSSKMLQHAAKGGIEENFNWVMEKLKKDYLEKKKKDPKLDLKEPKPTIEVLAEAIKSGNESLVRKIIDSWRSGLLDLLPNSFGDLLANGISRSWGMIYKELPDYIYHLAVNSSSTMLDAVLSGFSNIRTTHKIHLPDTCLPHSVYSGDIHLVARLLNGSESHHAIRLSKDLLSAAALKGDLQFFKEILGMVVPTKEEIIDEWEDIPFIRHYFSSPSSDTSSLNIKPIHVVSLPNCVLTNACISGSKELIEFLTTPNNFINDLEFDPLEHGVHTVQKIIESGITENLDLPGISEHLFKCSDYLIAAINSKNEEMYSRINSLENEQEIQLAPLNFYQSPETAEVKLSTPPRRLKAQSTQVGHKQYKTSYTEESPDRNEVNYEQHQGSLGSPSDLRKNQVINNSLLHQERIITSINHDNVEALEDSIPEGYKPSVTIIEHAAKVGAVKCLERLSLILEGSSSYIRYLIGRAKSHITLSINDANKLGALLNKPVVDLRESPVFSAALMEKLQESRTNAYWIEADNEEINPETCNQVTEGGNVHSIFSQKRKPWEVEGIHQSYVEKGTRSALNGEKLPTMPAQSSV